MACKSFLHVPKGAQPHLSFPMQLLESTPSSLQQVRLQWEKAGLGLRLLSSTLAATGGTAAGPGSTADTARWSRAGPRG